MTTLESNEDIRGLDDKVVIPQIDKHYLILKRQFDIIFSILVLIVLTPVLLLIALAIVIDDPKGKPIFTQRRWGKNCKEFRIYKFRSMRVNTPKYQASHDLTDPEVYLTRLGKVIRKYSIDELPQLLNVLKGDMSFVGPRPLIPEEKDVHETRIQKGVYQLTPGITGLAQIKGRDFVESDEKAYWDVKYLENFGFLQDLVILFTTIPKILSAEGVYEGEIPKNENLDNDHADI